METDKLLKITGGKLIGSFNPFSGFSFDSREIKGGEIFIALKGKRDGHDFISDAFEKGASGAIASREANLPSGKFLIIVNDTFEAYRKIARSKRNLFSGNLVAVTGSVGKTTTKELLHHLFSPHLSVYRNLKSYNNMLGVVHTLANLPENTSLYVQEVGTNSYGEVTEIAQLLKPDISVVTAVEIAHTAGFSSLDELVREKLSITEGVQVAVVPEKFRHLSRGKETITFGPEGDVKLLNFSFSHRGAEFTVSLFGKEILLRTKVPGYSVINATLIALAVSEVLGINLKDFSERLLSFSPPSMRCQVYNLKNGVLLIEDCYNANPASMKNAVDILAVSPGKRVAVLGEMLELGKLSKEEHEKLGKYLVKKGINVLISYGKEMEATYKNFKGEKFFFTDRKEFVNFICEYDFSESSVLIKGSRSNRLEEVAKIIKTRYGT